MTSGLPVKSGHIGSFVYTVTVIAYTPMLLYLFNPLSRYLAVMCVVINYCAFDKTGAKAVPSIMKVSAFFFKLFVRKGN